MLSEWALEKLKSVSHYPRVLLKDSLRLLPEADGTIHAFARQNGFTVIVSSTNLVFRDLYERAITDQDIEKILVVDRTPARRRASSSMAKAPPPFYPDLLANIPEEAHLTLDLQEFLKEKTGDPNWPAQVNEPRFARLIANHMAEILRAHQNLRRADDSRFTDHDMETIVAYAALGVAEMAFKKLQAKDYWKIGLLGHRVLNDLESLAPEVTRPLQEKLRKAPPPFCWFADYDAEVVVRAFYLSAILAQHTDLWSLVLPKIDPELAQFGKIKQEILTRDAPSFLALDPEKAQDDLQVVEDSLSRDSLQFLLIEQLKLPKTSGFAAVIENEQYSTLIRSLALLLALDDRVSTRPTEQAHNRITEVLSPAQTNEQKRFVDQRPSVHWSRLTEAYTLAGDIQELNRELGNTIKSLKVSKPEEISFSFFREQWNRKRLNRLEYYLSALERLVYSADLLPRGEDDLPSEFAGALLRIKGRVQAITDDVHRQLNELNLHFQQMVASQYPSWIASEDEVRLTSQFIRRCLKPHWDPEKEKAVILIFDGMRYDIWDEFLKPLIEDRMDMLADLPASSLLPSETHITRKAISAGTSPDKFDHGAGEDRLLKEALLREFGINTEVEVVSPEGMGIGETVRYRAGDLDVYIFELCDKELHKIQSKRLPDGREVPARPLAFVYEQHIKSIIENEVMAVLRSLQPGTKVFVTADHGFSRVGRERINLEDKWLNEPNDCLYLNARLSRSLSGENVPPRVKNNVWEFPVTDLRMPVAESGYDRRRNRTLDKKYTSIIFPRAGCAFSRPQARFNPDAFSHGGISLQELIIPMVALQVKQRDEAALALEVIEAPSEIVEGEEVEFRLELKRRASRGGGSEEVRIDVDADYGQQGEERFPLPNQVLYVPAKGTQIVYRLVPNTENATQGERAEGMMERTLTITVSGSEGSRTFRRTWSHLFRVRLNSEKVVRRVPPHLGSILGLTPKSMR